MSDQVHGRAALFQGNVAKQGFEFAVNRCHLYEQHLTVNDAETLDLNPRRAAHNDFGDLLGRGLEVDRLLHGKRPKPISPCTRQGDMARTRVDQRVDLPRAVRLDDVLNVYRREDSTHRRNPSSS